MGTEGFWWMWVIHRCVVMFGYWGRWGLFDRLIPGHFIILIFWFLVLVEYVLDIFVKGI